MFMRMLSVLLLFLLAGCASKLYRDTPEGHFTGALDVRWVANDSFVFLPNPDAPFTLVRASGEVITPGPIYTDGGSIPRFLWGVKGYSPWGYAPAYIVHDWLFEVKHCGFEPQYSFEDSIDVFAQGLKALMEQNPEVRNYFVFDSVVASISSPIAERLWEQGSCDVPVHAAAADVPGEEPLLSVEPPGELLMTIRFE